MSVFDTQNAKVGLRPTKQCPPCRILKGSKPKRAGDNIFLKVTIELLLILEIDINNLRVLLIHISNIVHHLCMCTRSIAPASNSLAQKRHVQTCITQEYESGPLTRHFGALLDSEIVNNKMLIIMEGGIRWGSPY